MVHCSPLPLLSTLLFLLSLSGPLYCGATEYYVKPTEGTPCPEPCHTLIEYAQNASQYFTSAVNVTVSFLPGVHHLDQKLLVTNASNMSFQVHPIATAGGSNVTILCNSGSFEFVNTSNLTIEHLILSQCGIPCPSDYGPYLVDLSSCIYSSEDKGVGSINLNNITNLRIVGVTLEKGWPIVTQNVVGYSEIADLTARNTNIWGLVVSFDDSLSSTINTSLSNHLVVRDSQYYGNDVDFPGRAICVRTDTLTVEIDIVRISINRDIWQAVAPDIRLYLAPSSSEIAIMDCHLANGWVGILVEQDVSVSPQISSNIPMEGHVLISGCEIKGYTGIPLQFVTYGRNNIFQVTIVDSVFANNSCSTEPGSCSVLSTMTPVTLINTTFEDNIYIDPMGLATTVYLDGVNNARFINCTFHRNIGTPISAINSSYIVSGNMRFVNNTGQKGGAMAFYKDSQVIIDSDIHILFQNNSAVVGGAIYVDNVVDDYYLNSSPPRCFLAFTCSDMITSVSLDFINNTATDGGNAIYGAMLDICLYNQGRGAATVISRISHFEPSEDLSKITSPPSRVCLCDEDGKPDCASSLQSVYPRPKCHYPGETFTISAVLVGDEFGTVSGSVYAQFLLLNKSRTAPQFGTLQQSQSVGHDSCTDLKYTVLSENVSEIIVLTAGKTAVDSFVDKDHVCDILYDYKSFGSFNQGLFSLPVYLNITLLSCPLGFTLASPPGECVCNKRMKANNITCNITDQTLHRSGITWIDASSDGVIIATNCPFHYCKPGEVAVNLLSPDSQCEFNHSGTLCGGCQPGFSLALGSSQCLPCSNKYLALLIAFIAAGIALVFFIKIFNHTVSKGTINGLIFYANIVGAIPTTFFPAGDTNILTVFIAWLNLDLSIQTCFFDGLDAYWKTWLQFVFPAYILAIIGLIILLSRLSEWVTKIFGSNSADILATLLLLSYAKLFRTIIAALSFSFLELPDGTRTAVWSLDGNIPYLSGKHIPLFLVALAVLLLLWLPFTAVLLFWQLLQRVTHYKIMWIVRWIVIKRRPFFDTYFGPLKGEHRYWVGVLLLVRGILLIIFAVVPTDSTGVNLLSVSTVSIILLTYVANLPQSQQQGEDRRTLVAGQNLSLSQKVHDYLGMFSGCYNSWYLSLLENSFILNLEVLSVATLYVYSSGGNQAAVVYTSVGIAFAQFVGIVCLHVFLSLRKWWKNRREKVDGELQGPNRAEYERIDDEPAPVRDGPLLRVDFSQYREPVLEHFD